MSFTACNFKCDLYIHIVSSYQMTQQHNDNCMWWSFLLYIYIYIFVLWMTFRFFKEKKSIISSFYFSLNMWRSSELPLGVSSYEAIPETFGQLEASLEVCSQQLISKPCTEWTSFINISLNKCIPVLSSDEKEPTSKTSTSAPVFVVTFSKGDKWFILWIHCMHVN